MVSIERNQIANDVHLRLMAKIPGIVEIRRFKAASGTYAGTAMEGDKYVAEYDIESADIIEQTLSSPEREKALKDHVIRDYMEKYFTTTRTLYLPIYSISKE